MVPHDRGGNTHRLVVEPSSAIPNAKVSDIFENVVQRTILQIEWRLYLQLRLKSREDLKALFFFAKGQMRPPPGRLEYGQASTHHYGASLPGVTAPRGPSFKACIADAVVFWPCFNVSELR